MIKQPYIHLQDGSAKQMYWKRRIIITFTSKLNKQKLIFDTKNTNSLSITVDGYKYMSLLKDSCTIQIQNLTYREITQLIADKYYDVEIECGYENLPLFKIFEGGVIYISQDLGDRKTTTCVILCGSNAIAKFSQKRLNLSLNSGINYYSALKFICKMSDMPNTNVSEQFKTKFLQETLSMNTTATSFIETLINSNESYVANTEETEGVTLNLLDLNRMKNAKVTVIDDKTITLADGYPRAESTGINFSVIPVNPFACGEIVKLDPSLINIFVGSTDQIQENTAAHIRANGLYIIKEIHYVLENRGHNFKFAISGITASFLDNY